MPPAVERGCGVVGRQRAENFPAAGDRQATGLDPRAKLLEGLGQVHPFIGHAVRPGHRADPPPAPASRRPTRRL